MALVVHRTASIKGSGGRKSDVALNLGCEQQRLVIAFATLMLKFIKSLLYSRHQQFSLAAQTDHWTPVRLLEVMPVVCSRYSGWCVSFCTGWVSVTSWHGNFFGVWHQSGKMDSAEDVKNRKWLWLSVFWLMEVGSEGITPFLFCICVFCASMVILELCLVSLSQIPNHLYIYLSTGLSVDMSMLIWGSALEKWRGYLLNLEFPISSGVVGGHEPLLETLDSLLAHFLLRRHTAVDNKGKVIVLHRLIRDFIAFLEVDLSLNKYINKQTNKQYVVVWYAHTNQCSQFAVVPLKFLTLKDKDSCDRVMWGLVTMDTPVAKLFPPIFYTSFQPNLWRTDYLQSNDTAHSSCAYLTWAITLGLHTCFLLTTAPAEADGLGGRK